MKLKALFLVAIIFGISSAQTNSTKDASNENKAFLYKGWMKFFSFVPTMKTGNFPSKFEYNQAYYNQFIGGKNVSFDPAKDKDQYGWYDIPDDHHFFFVLTKKTLFVISARRVSLSYS